MREGRERVSGRAGREAQLLLLEVLIGKLHNINNSKSNNRHSRGGK